jgi:hypothetical protein
MGKFLEGWERARVAAEEREAARRRRAEQVSDALKQLTEVLEADNEVLNKRNITLRIEHGALVLKRAAEPLAGITFDPETGHFRIHEYFAAEGKNEMDAQDIEDCAMKLGEYAYSLES